MVLFNHATREMTAKIVYYGPGLCGKTTNLMVIFDKLDQTAARSLSASASSSAIDNAIMPRLANQMPRATRSK